MDAAIPTILLHLFQGTEVDKSDIRTVYSLFQDVERSVAFLHQYQKQFLYDERGDEGAMEVEPAAAAAAGSSSAAAAAGAAASASGKPEAAMEEDDDADL